MFGTDDRPSSGPPAGRRCFRASTLVHVGWSRRLRRIGGGALTTLGMCSLVQCTAPTPAAAALPDGRVYELVSPPEKGGNSAGAITGKVLYSVARSDGERVLFGTSGPVGESQSGLGPAYAVAERGAGGWSTRGVLPRPVGTIEVIADDPFQMFYPSRELSSFAFATRGPYVAEGDEALSPNLFMSGENAAIPPLWIAKPTIPDPVPGPGELTNFRFPALAGPPSSIGSVYFTYFGTLVPEDTTRAPLVSGESVWGFYEWNAGRLRSAGRLPDGSYDAYGAVPAASGERGKSDMPDALDNQVSEDGSRAVFVSPDPESPHPAEDPVELYARVNGERVVLVSRNALNGGTPAAGYLQEGNTTGVTARHPPARCEGGCSRGSFAYATPNGSRVFFASMDKLAKSSEGQEPTGTGPWTYEFDVGAETLSYLPGVNGSIVATSQDGTIVMFVAYESEGGNAGSLNVWSHGHNQVVGDLPEPPESRELYVAPARATKDGAVFAFETDAAITNARDRSGENAATNAGGFGQVYRYDTSSQVLICVSCPNAGDTATGDANLSNDDLGRDTEHEPGAGLVLGSRGMMSDGSGIFFDTPNALQPTDVNGVRDVYEWEGGEVHLISSGTNPHPSFFLDSNESGADVFFATAAGLVPNDMDGNYDVYDARAAHVAGEQLGFAPSTAAAGCGAECQGATAGEPPPPTLFSAMSGNSGNDAGSTFTSPKRTHLTRSQKLTLALRACKRKPRKQRPRCVGQAHRRYGGAARAGKSKRTGNR
jgi:hypothetical protein